MPSELKHDRWPRAATVDVRLGGAWLRTGL